MWLPWFLAALSGEGRSYKKMKGVCAVLLSFTRPFLQSRQPQHTTGLPGDGEAQVEMGQRTPWRGSRMATRNTPVQDGLWRSQSF